MDNCCGGQVQSESIYNMLQALVDSKVINVQLFTIAVGIFFMVLLWRRSRKYSPLV
ncbi:uncharacterized protein LOC115627744 [Scaptodrosophila lebanonensis]|uniref:Uncharacterized protein LOC115627744 n=1 Tax=Drosophila lebanonensis TaxID=7225 RepID=A0A6J2TTI6_DROLE|nr:uncharacterized protein LOC115627744 [Scaptodrosophila lebanonensis]